MVAAGTAARLRDHVFFVFPLSIFTVSSSISWFAAPRLQLRCKFPKTKTLIRMDFEKLDKREIEKEKSGSMNMRSGSIKYDKPPLARQTQWMWRPWRVRPPQDRADG